VHVAVHMQCLQVTVAVLLLHPRRHPWKVPFSSAFIVCRQQLPQAGAWHGPSTGITG
jgi:hypothetical protein